MLKPCDSAGKVRRFISEAIGPSSDRLGSWPPSAPAPRQPQTILGLLGDCSSAAIRPTAFARIARCAFPPRSSGPLQDGKFFGCKLNRIRTQARRDHFHLFLGSLLSGRRVKGRREILEGLGVVVSPLGLFGRTQERRRRDQLLAERAFRWRSPGPGSRWTTVSARVRAGSGRAPGVVNRRWDAGAENPVAIKEDNEDRARADDRGAAPQNGAWCFDWRRRDWEFRTGRATAELAGRRARWATARGEGFASGRSAATSSGGAFVSIAALERAAEGGIAVSGKALGGASNVPADSTRMPPSSSYTEHRQDARPRLRFRRRGSTRSTTVALVASAAASLGYFAGQSDRSRPGIHRVADRQSSGGWMMTSPRVSAGHGCAAPLQTRQAWPRCAPREPALPSRGGTRRRFMSSRRVSREGLACVPNRSRFFGPR